jgi:hypothetical protein
MSTRVAELEKRVAALEREMGLLRQLLEARPIKETPAQAGARMLREAERSQAELTAGWGRAMEQLGIRGELIGVEKLRERMLAEGIKPEDNILSRGILEMREE